MFHMYNVVEEGPIPHSMGVTQHILGSFLKGKKSDLLTRCLSAFYELQNEALNDI